jgi:His/Glu/Gln/Arg/opine family amino acid ABC transporter permease subunit
MQLAYTFEWSFIWENRGELVDGVVKTLEISAIAIGGAYAIGVVLGAARAYRIPVVSQLTGAYVEFIRNTPILVQLFFVFFGLPQLGLRIDQFTVAWLWVMIWGGAFNSENFRAGFEAVPHRYREAGLALGFGRLATFFHVTLPIGGRIALPSTINTSISVLKNTAIVGVAIGFAEVTYVAYNIQAVTFRVFEMFFVLGVVYLAIVWSLSALIRLVEARLALPEEVR